MKTRIGFLISIFIFLITPSLDPHQWGKKDISLRISPHSLTFHPADPDTEPSIPGDSSIQVEIEIDSNRQWNLTILADGDLRGERGASINIENITWQAAPSPPFYEGRLSKRSPQLVAQGEGKTQVNGEIFFYLKNSWEYQAGEYSQTISLTLSCL